MKRVHITTPIFYPNAKPHLGHFYTSILCDVQNRYYKLNKFNSVKNITKFTTGTDEHGMKIQNAALKANLDTQKFVDNLSLTFKELCSKSNIKYDRFIRTTDSDHVKEVQNLWNMCKDDIFMGDHAGWYSVSDETFYPAIHVRELINGNMVSLDSNVDYSNVDKSRTFINTETNNNVIFFQEKNYFFDLNKYKDRLIDYIIKNPDFVQPSNYKNTLLNTLKTEQLTSLSVSRPTKRLEWAIKVPNDSSQSVYVWFDALCNYLTSIGSLNKIKDPSSTESEFMRNTTHVIGKDIIKFHCIYWPMFLMSAGLPLPKCIVVHGHWVNDGVKMSKSLGNVVDPLEYIEKYGSDSLRLAVLSHSNLIEDNNFSATYVSESRNIVLVNKLCNLVSRTSKKFNPRPAVEFWQPIFKQNQGRITPELYESFDEHFKESKIIKTALKEIEYNTDWLINNYETSMEKFEYQKVLGCLMNLLNSGNSLFQNAEPWAIKDKDLFKHRDLVLFLSLEVVRIFCIYASPIVPEIASNVLKTLEVPESETLDLSFAKLGAGSAYSKQSKKGISILTRVNDED
ncbi:related to Methionine--tRNA ligase, mitochondrial [Hanseniaspora guilliermondii]|uniref:methionine--tRNA ligase n=1 Tax=Hanseniaspora guilliermondii TaxID=56406 RepID=A0A1L0B5B6_9ASCO|nr:related to Methionine--tRNA ligase, mitochondrial [Hanseniaspora guilliermondii]